MYAAEFLPDLCFTSPIHKPNDESTDIWSHASMSMPEFQIKSGTSVMELGPHTVTFDEALKLSDFFASKPSPASHDLVMPIIKQKKAKKKKSPLAHVYRPFASIESTELTVRQLRLLSK